MKRKRKVEVVANIEAIDAKGVFTPLPGAKAVRFRTKTGPVVVHLTESGYSLLFSPQGEST